MICIGRIGCKTDFISAINPVNDFLVFSRGELAYLLAKLAYFLTEELFFLIRLGVLTKDSFGLDSLPLFSKEQLNLAAFKMRFGEIWWKNLKNSDS